MIKTLLNLCSVIPLSVIIACYYSTHAQIVACDLSMLGFGMVIVQYSWWTIRNKHWIILHLCVCVRVCVCVTFTLNRKYCMKGDLLEVRTYVKCEWKVIQMWVTVTLAISRTYSFFCQCKEGSGFNDIFNHALNSQRTFCCAKSCNVIEFILSRIHLIELILSIFI